MKIICYMMMSLDGRIDCRMTEKINGSDEYYDILNEYNFDSYISGKITASMHYASGVYQARNNEEIGISSIYLPIKSKNFSIVADTYGSLKWDSNKIGNDNLLIILSEKASKEYLNYLKSLNISYIAIGKDKIDLNSVVKILSESLGIEKLGIVGGGNINASFLKCGLIDEISILIGPGIDGRRGMASVFDGLDSDTDVFRLNLFDVKKYDNGAVLLKYTILK